MSIEPEVPYEADTVYEDTWRDPTILPDRNALNMARGGDTSLSYPNEEASKPDRTPDDYWILPPNATFVDIVGAHKQRIEGIRNSTGTYISFNEARHQMDIWGDRVGIEKAKTYFSHIAEGIIQHKTDKKPKSATWEKANKELTGKAKLKREKLEARLVEERSFQGRPIVAPTYNAVFAIPDHSLPLVKLLGEKESYLNSLRAECKCHMWYDESFNLIRLASNSEKAVKLASARIRNWYLKCTRRLTPSTLRLIHQPSENLMVHFRTLPIGFMSYQYATAAQEAEMQQQHRLLEPIVSGYLQKLENLIDLDDNEEEAPKEDTISERIHTLNTRNQVSIQRALGEGLESLRLLDWEIRLKIRYGQICLVNYPSKKKVNYTIENLTDKYLPNSKFYSVLAPCIGKTREDMSQLFEFLSTRCEEYSDSPRTSFSIDALQYPTFSPPPSHRRGEVVPPRGDPWKTVLTASFTSEGRVGLWNCLTDCDALVAINCANLESEYSWEAKLEHARRLSTEADTPHKQFANALRQSPENRLVLVNVPEYVPKTVTQKTKWTYGWGDYVVEIGKDELWDISLIQRGESILPIDLGSVDPHRTLFKVAIYKEVWRNRFAENLFLKVGEAPSWTSNDFLATETEDVQLLMEVAKQFGDILSREVPVYWSKSELQSSLV
ncbi:hypothetical protein BDF14DRAFT_508799 [Spinellus fusiger]|nr:hypothetical protein BDF14DRAFT_508799 [Spinellus fusiger]